MEKNRSATNRGARLLAAVCAVALGACADQTAPVAPTAGPALKDAKEAATTSTSTAPSTTEVAALLWTEPVTQSSTYAKVLDENGGSFSTKTGLKVTVPAGAVSGPTTFTVTTVPGSIVAYDFGPHGVTFKVPLVLEQPTKGTNIGKAEDPGAAEGAYYSDPAALDQASGTAAVSEFQPTKVTADKSLIRFTVSHFSGYLVSLGRASQTAQ